MSGKLLEEPKQIWVENLLNLWGAWAFSGLDFESRMNMLARLMLQADPSRVSEPVREMCDDELGLVISTVIGYYVKNPCPDDYKYLEAKYMYGVFKNSMRHQQGLSFCKMYQRKGILISVLALKQLAV